MIALIYKNNEIISIGKQICCKPHAFYAIVLSCRPDVVRWGVLSFAHGFARKADTEFFEDFVVYFTKHHC